MKLLSHSCSPHRMLVVTVFLMCIGRVLAQSDGIPRGAQLPYIRYESENGQYGGGATLQQAPTFDQNAIASEASNQKYVSLPSNGSYVQWTTSAIARGVTLRFTMPDDNAGNGLSGSLSFYVGNTRVKVINLTSYWAYQYFPAGQSEPVQTYSSGAKTFMRFDEVHFRLDNPIPAGSVVKIVKENGDNLTYGVDFIELEDVPAALPAPTNSLSVTAYGAVPDDNVDDLAAFNACLAAAAAQGKNVYIPAGRFILSDKWIVNVSNMKIQGAGIWYTELYFSTDKQFYGGIMARSTNVEISDFYLNTANNDRFKYDEANARVPGDPYKIYKGFMGTYGTNSKIHDVWIEHFECGMWIGGYDPPYPIDVTDGLVISRARIRNNYADGVNFCQGTSNSVVEYSSIRNEGDDGLAMWPNNYMNAPQERNNIFRYCTIENNWRAGGIAIFGGTGHQVYRCIIKDGVAGSAIRFTNDFPGYTFEQNAPKIICTDNYIENCGTSYDLWNQKRGAIELYTPNGIYDVEFNNTIIINSQRHAIQLYGSIHNMVFNNTTIDGTGMDAFVDQPTLDDWGGFGILAQANGNVTFNNVSFNRIESYKPGTDPIWGNIKNHNAAFVIVVNNTNVPLTGITLSPTTLSIAEGQTAQLTVTFAPTNATNKNLTWTSSNPNVATVVSAGTGLATVTAVRTGTATITVTSVDGNFSKSCQVTVTPAVNIQATDPDAAEGGNPGTFVISTSSTASNIVVGYTVSGSASASDYTPTLSGNVTLTPSAPSATITINPVDDNVFEGAETLTLTLNSGTGYALGGNTSATITIADNDNPPCTAPIIAYTTTAPAIDGSVDNVWTSAPASAINNVILGTRSSDYSGQWRALSDNNNLYVLVEVTDGQKYNDSGTSWWEDDVVEIFIDGDNSKGTTYDGLNDFQLGFRYNDNAVQVGGNSVNRTTGIQYRIVSTTNGYVLEASIPWGTIGVTPAIGKRIGFEVEIDDDDNGGTRDAQYAAFATTTMAWSNPSVFGSVYITTCSTNIVPVTGVTVSPTTANVSVGGTVQLTATVAPTNATNKTVSWSSSNTAVATVNSSGLITGVSAGTATITVTTQDGGKTASSTVTVTATTVPVTGVTVSPTTANVSVGGTVQLTATVAPTNATNKTVSWSSSNTAVATVSSSGLVTGVSAGTATITVTTQDGGKTATSTVTVTAPLQTPFQGSPVNIPGTVEAENFDNGGQNVAYYDTDAANNGGQYRTNEAVDIEVCSAGGYNVGWMYSGEWLEYTINVTSTGSYNFECRVASAVGGSFVMYIDNTDISGTVNVPNTGGWQVWQSVTKANVNLTAGTHILKVQSNGGINLDKIIIASASAPANTYRIKNRWQNTYLYDAGDRVRYAASATNATYNWQLESLGNGQYEIRNASTGEYMHIENLLGYVQCTARTPGWMSSRWTLEDAGSGYVRIRNVWQSSYYIHIENLQNQAQYGTINSSWWSAMWLLEPVTGSSRVPVAVNTTHNSESIQMYPNPITDGWLRIQIAHLVGMAEIRIVDLQGKTVLQLSTRNTENSLNLSSLKAGMYMIYVLYDGENFVSKLMVQ